MCLYHDFRCINTTNCDTNLTYKSRSAGSRTVGNTIPQMNEILTTTESSGVITTVGWLLIETVACMHSIMVLHIPKSLFNSTVGNDSAGGSSCVYP